METKRESGGRGVQSIEVGGRLLRTLAEASAPLMLRTLASKADISPAQAHAYLVSFRRAAMVERDAASGLYSLGPLALRMGLARMRSVEPLSGAGRTAADLADQLGLTVSVVVWGPRAPTAVQVQQGARSLDVNVREGTLFSVVGSACGRVFAAFSDPDVVGARIRQEFDGDARDVGLGAPISRSQFEVERSRVRRLGYAEGAGVPTPGFHSIAAPVFSASGSVQLVLSMIGPADALPMGSRGAAVARLVDACRALSRSWPTTPELAVNS